MHTSITAVLSIAAIWIAKVVLETIIGKVYLFISTRKNGCKAPVRAWGLDPLFGIDATWTMMKARFEHRQLKLVQSVFDRLGATYEAILFGKRVVNTSDPRLAQAVFSTEFNSFSVERHDIMAPLMGLGLMTANGEVWHKQRSMVKGVFNRSQINDRASFDVHVSRMLEHIPRDGSTIDLMPLFDQLNLDAASEFIFGESVECLLPENERARSFIHSFNTAQKSLGLRFFLGKARFLYREKNVLETCKYVRDYSRSLIDQALAREPDPERTRRLVVYEISDKAQTDKQLVDYLMNVFLPSKDTLGVLLTNVLFASARHPLVWKKLREEVAGLDYTTLTFDDLKNLKYLQNVLNETLRFYPIVAVMGRVATVPVKLPHGGGPDGEDPVFLEAGTTVFTYWASMFRRRETFGDDVNEYRPERWDDLKLNNWEFAPFSRGPRSCPGQSLALFWTSYALVRMAQIFEKVENRDEQFEFVEDLKLICQSKNGCKVALKVA